MDSLVERLRTRKRFIRAVGYRDDHPYNGAGLMDEAAASITELERQLKVAREALGEVTDYGDLQAVRIARQALADMRQADD